MGPGWWPEGRGVSVADWENDADCCQKKRDVFSWHARNVVNGSLW